MSDTPPSPEPQPLQVTGVPGCGLAAYAALLLTICLTGVIGIVLSTRAILTQQPESVSKLVHGSQVATWRLQPMRDAKLLKLTQVPNAWHDQSPMRDGTQACALTDNGIAILNDEALAIPFHEVQTLRIDAEQEGHNTVVIVGQTATGSCVFGPQEGGERFARQINAERSRNGDLDPHKAPQSIIK